ncbi:MAG: Protein N-acetyltransferase, RimJ/RimL family [Spartobacteria bacterium]|nr:Protein N-acetyltransferase, RimJ/RimL family [Spartobacteria bacterium]
MERTCECFVIFVISMTQIETERLILRPFEPERDAAFILEVLNEPAYIANVADRGVRTVAQAADYIREKFLPGHQRYGIGYCVVELKAGGVPIGTCGLVKRETMEDFDIGYSILERFSGRGYAFEAASALMHYGRTKLGLKRIIGLTSSTNATSAHLLEKLGLRFERMVKVSGFESESRLFGWQEEDGASQQKAHG